MISVIRNCASTCGVLMLMKYSPDWRVFMDRLNQEYPQWGKTMLLPFPDNYTPPDASVSNSDSLNSSSFTHP